MPVGRRPRNQQLSFTTRPRMLNMRSFQTKPSSSAPTTSRRSKTRKPPGGGRFDQLGSKSTMHDYTDFAYKEAVGKLKSMLTDSYSPIKYRHSKIDDSDDESGVSFMMSDTTRVARLGAYRRPQPRPFTTAEPATVAGQTPEMLSFIERQEEYIEQLERESQYCRDELSQLLGKVKDLIHENETLHAQQRTGTLPNPTDGFSTRPVEMVKMEGPSIVFESRISELEAQLTQARLDLKKAQDEASKRRIAETDPTASSEFYRQIDALHREKRDLSEALNKLQASIATIREKESDSARKVLRTQDVAEKAQIDRQQAEMEVQRLKSELDHQHQRLLDVLSEQTRKVAEERSQAERRYLQHVEQLNAELAVQRDTSAKLQMELDRHLRVEEDLRRDLTAKSHTAENIRKELNAKISSLQSELAGALADRDALEQELSTHKMSGERSERHNRQEASRLQIEVNALRQRIERNDAELIQARRENLRLSEQISMQDSEIAIYKARVGEFDDEDGSKKASTVRELEGVVEKQAQAMKLLNQQCQNLTHTLEETTARHKHEMEELQNSVEFLTNRLEASLAQRSWPPEDYTQPTEHFQEHFEPETANYTADPVTYQTDTNYPKTEDTQPATVATTAAAAENVTVELKPALSRASSRGERSESPQVKKLVGRESRAPIPTEYDTYPEYYPDYPAQDPYRPPSRGAAYPETNRPPSRGAAYPETNRPPSRGAAYPETNRPPSRGAAYPETNRPPSRGGYPDTNRPPSRGGVYPDTNRPPSRGPYPDSTRLRKSSSGESSTTHQPVASYDPYYQRGSPDQQPVFAEPSPVYPDYPVDSHPGYLTNDPQSGYSESHPVYPASDNHPVYPETYPASDNHPVYPETHPVYPETHPVYPATESQLVYPASDNHPVYPESHPESHPVYPETHSVYPETHPVYPATESQLVYPASDNHPGYPEPHPVYPEVPPPEGRSKYPTRSSRPPSTSEFEVKPADPPVVPELARQPSSVRRESSVKNVTGKNQRNTPTKFQ